MVISRLKNGTEVKVLGEKEGWYEIEIPSEYAWVCGKYLQVTRTTPQETEEGYTFDIDGEMMLGFLKLFEDCFRPEPEPVPDPDADYSEDEDDVGEDYAAGEGSDDEEDDEEDESGGALMADEMNPEEQKNGRVVTKPTLKGQEDKGRNIWDNVKTNVPNRELKSMVEAYKTRAPQERSAEPRESAREKLDALVKDTASKLTPEKTPKAKSKSKKGPEL